MKNNYSQKSINILKASLPFIPVNMQKTVSNYIKIEEFNNMIKNLNSSIDDTLQACEFDSKENKTNFNSQDLLSAIKPYLNKSEIELVNMIVNFSKAYNMYNSYGLNNINFNNLNSNNTQSFDDKNENPDSDKSNIETLKSMLSPNQRAMFDTYLNLLNNNTNQSNPI